MVVGFTYSGTLVPTLNPLAKMFHCLYKSWDFEPYVNPSKSNLFFEFSKNDIKKIIQILNVDLPNGGCIRQNVLIVALKPKYLSNLTRKDLFTAENVFLTTGNPEKTDIKFFM